MEIIVACVVSFVATALLGGKVILPALRRLKAGQEIREIGPKWHATKAGTPTMGGLMFILAIAVALAALSWGYWTGGRLGGLYTFLFALVFGAIGFLDDYEKVKKHQNLGLTALQKFLLQLAAAIVFLMLMRYEGLVSPNLYIPFINTSVPISWPLYMVFAAFVIVGTVNAVNLTDGLDGLATSVTIPASTGNTSAPATRLMQHTLAFPVSMFPATTAVTELSVWVTPWATTPLSAQKAATAFFRSRPRGATPAIRTTTSSSSPRPWRGLATASQCRLAWVIRSSSAGRISSRALVRSRSNIAVSRMI